MTKLAYSDVYALSNAVAEMDDLSIPTEHSAALRLFDADGNHYATIERVPNEAAVLRLHGATSTIQDTPGNGWKPGMD